MIDEVVMLRHGRTAYNLAHRLQGQIDVPLDIVGQWQADQSGYALASQFYWAKVSACAAHPELIAQPPASAAERTDLGQYREAPAAARRMVVISSDLFRAQQTAHAFADLLGLDVILDERLRERSFGQWEGLTREEIKSIDAAAYASWKQHTGGETRYGVESRAHVGQRGAKAVRELIEDPRYAGTTPTTMMLVGHGSWITATITRLLDLNPDGMNALGGMRNACWCRLKVRHTVNGRDVDEPLFELQEYNTAPPIANNADWENGPAELRGPSIPDWQPIVW
ncbi:histidine phosphatase family protein [Bifidobacterium scaligerum]|uniref:Histidine phosphatase family protein n=1 Tax=Bifidobacterium scaligerum TaxID=2052656 RepID=A0A2M9HTE6_9BIFI|nr:histidine phosphatase family protein [Bifidobacterium scaligerum]PJM80090.1 histidine phosphatase family protein [Bifidobacterium scaligerum]